MAKNNSRRIILKLPQSDESPALGFSVPARNCKALRVNVNRGLRVLKKNALPPPIAKKIRRARVRALSGMVSCLLLAQNDANQVIGARRVITVLHFRRDLVVGLCHYAWQGNTCRIIAKRSERFDVSHDQRIQILQECPSSGTCPDPELPAEQTLSAAETS